MTHFASFDGSAQLPILSVSMENELQLFQMLPT